MADLLAIARRKIVPLEYTEQVWLFQWAELAKGQYPDLEWLYAIPNGGYLLSKAAAGKLKAAGLKKGYPDIGLDVARRGYYGLRIEMKRQSFGTVSEEQHAWIRRLKAQGYLAVVCRGFEDAKAQLVWYLNERA